jgi:hypothetical protein
MSADARHWRIVVERGQHRAVCVGCDWTCPLAGCCGSTAVRAAHALHTACAEAARTP